MYCRTGLLQPQASAFETDIEEATDNRPSTISPSIPRSPSSVAFNAWNNLSNFMRPSPAPIAAPTPAPTPAQAPTSAPPESPEGDTVRNDDPSFPNYIANRTSEFIAEVKEVTPSELTRLAQLLQYFERSGFEPSEDEVLAALHDTTSTPNNSFDMTRTDSNSSTQQRFIF
jgi:hypothetical protein